MVTYRQPFAGDYPISQLFGEKITDPKGHTGIDYACPLGTPILASADGTVSYLQTSNVGYGNDVMLLHPDGNYTLYAHLSSIAVKRWQKVKQGDVIAYSGNTGNSTGPHLHFEARDVTGKAFDPMQLPLMSVDDNPVNTSQEVVNTSQKLKEPSELGDLVEVVCPDGAKAFNSDWSMKYYGFPQGTKLHFTGKTAQRPGFPEYTYCEVYEEPIKYFVAVHNNQVQILDKAIELIRD